METEDYNKRKRIEEYWELLKEGTRARHSASFQAAGIIAIISTIMTSGSFEMSYFEIHVFLVQMILTISLLVLPIALFLYLYEMNKAAILAQKSLQEELNRELTQGKKNIIDWANVYFPWFLVFFIFVAALCMILIIWV